MIYFVSKKGQSALVVTPSNYPNDDLAQTIHTVLQQSGSCQKIVVRAHSLVTEDEVFEAQGLEPATSTLPSPFKAATDKESIKDLAIAQYFKDFYSQAMERPNGILDPRACLLDVSIGVGMF